MTTQTYFEASVLLLAQAEAELAAGDVRQASEKGWGAAAQAVKAVAEQRDWPHRSHASLFRVVDRLVEETRDNDLGGAFRVGSHLHTNFYENWDSEAGVRDSLGDIRRFVEKLTALL